jgi:malonyl-CoA O-methyltransferase
MNELPIDPQAVQWQWNRRLAPGVFLHIEVARRMIERLDVIRIAPQQIINAGAGLGDDIGLLSQRFPGAAITAIERAPARLAAGERGWPHAGLAARWRAWRGGPKVTWVAGDFGSVVLAPACAQLVWSNCALHWSARPDEVLKHWAPWLQTDGLLMFSAFGPDTFRELRQAGREAGLPAVTLPFVDMHDHGDMLIEAGLANPVMDVEILRLQWTDVAALFADLRSFGGNAHRERSAHLLGRRRWQRFVDALDAMRNPQGQIELTVELIQGHAWRPPPRKPGVSTVALDQLRANLPPRR